MPSDDEMRRMVAEMNELPVGLEHRRIERRDDAWGSTPEERHDEAVVRASQTGIPYDRAVSESYPDPAKFRTPEQLQADMYQYMTAPRHGTPHPPVDLPRQHRGKQDAPSLVGRLDDALGESARQFQWLVDETAAMRALVSAESQAHTAIRRAALGHSVKVTRAPSRLLNAMIDGATSGRKKSS